MFGLIFEIVKELVKGNLNNDVKKGYSNKSTLPYIEIREKVEPEKVNVNEDLKENIVTIKDFFQTPIILRPTEEQAGIVEGLKKLNFISINAFAGTGKTTTLGFIVGQYRDKKILVLAFNRAMARELREKFREFSNVDVYTTHGLAYNHTRKILGIEEVQTERALPKFIKEQLQIEDINYASFLKDLLVGYCRSSETFVSVETIANLIKNDSKLSAYYTFGLKNKDLGEIADNVEKVYKKALEQKFIFHDLYLKYFQVNIGNFLSKFRDYFALLLDEAQDTNPVTYDLFMKIPAEKKVIVGDKHQNIYSWRGARNYLSNNNFNIFYLTETFRFGENIARIANDILKTYKGETNYIRPTLKVKKGNGKTAYITRTNVKIIELINETSEEKVAFLRSLDDIFKPVLYAREIIYYYTHKNFYGFIELPEYLVAIVKSFKTLSEFEDYCKTFDRELYMAIKIANCYEIDVIKRKAESLCNKEAKVVFATAHTTKGLEFEKVIVEDDFPNLEELIYERAFDEAKKEIEKKVKRGEIAEMLDLNEILLRNVEKVRKAIKEDDINYSDLINEVNLQYVAVTRAQKEVSIKFNNDLANVEVAEYLKELEVYLESMQKSYQETEMVNKNVSENNENESGSSKEITLIPGVTKLYHKIFGEGVFVRLEKKNVLEGKENCYIYVKFENGDIKIFSYPSSLRKHLFFDKSDLDTKSEKETSISDKLNNLKPNRKQEMPLIGILKDSLDIKDDFNIASDDNKSNGTNVREKFKEIVKRRNIEYLVHFTNLENVKSIWEKGLLPIDYIKKYKISAHINDCKRLDGCTNAVSLSISFPNYKMFYRIKKDNANEKWAVLLLEPRIIWEKECAFNKNNAASTESVRLALEYKKSVESFLAMFDDDELRRKLGLPDNYTTDPQAEILVFDIIEPEYIKKIVVEKEIDKKILHLFHKIPENMIVVNEELFSPRFDWKYWQKR